MTNSSNNDSLDDIGEPDGLAHGHSIRGIEMWSDVASGPQDERLFSAVVRPAVDDAGESSSLRDVHGLRKTETTAFDAWFQLTKAYIGPGCLSLPWAVSQLGLPLGVFIVCLTSLWTSYNCWNVVRLKRIIMRERGQTPALAHLTHHQVTYPDVGEWAYNRTFRDLLLVSICVQQLAVCTVFLSFIGENIAAVMARTLTDEGDKAPSHALVITMAFPFAMMLSCLPNLKVLSPVMVVATASLFVGFGLLGVVVEKEWDNRPRDVDMYDIHWSQVPMAVCAILYSYEGICVILPIESAMEKPQHFKTVFVTSMSFTAFVFAAVAVLCCMAFGDVTNGSVTAFLVENLHEQNVKWWLYMTNTAVSVAVLLTYPLQLFPSFELIGPWLTRVFRLDLGTQGFLRHREGHNPISGFSQVSSCDNPEDGIRGNHYFDYHDPSRISTSTAPTHNATAVVAGDTAVETEELEDEEELPAFFAAFPTPGDSPQLRAILVCFTYIMAIAIPNVQLLVSLAGALSGSATGLIIPPLLELSYIKRQEKELEDRTADDEDMGHENATTLMKLRAKKWESYVLFGAGVIICVFGTGSALADIVRVYMGR